MRGVVEGAIGLLLVLGCAGCHHDDDARHDDPRAAAASASALAAHEKLVGEMVKIPAGVFARESEGASHEVRVDAFELDKTEVTARAYQACVDAGACKARTTVDWDGLTEKKKRLYSLPCNGGRPDRQMHPMNCVDWQDASSFCAWAGKRLPTEDEWEWAARGPEDRTYPWGEQQPERTRLNVCGTEVVPWAKKTWNRDWTTMYDGDDGWPTTSPVGTYPAGATPLGVLDMAGNVWEWTSSYYEEGDPSYRVHRGGSWNNNETQHVRGTFRNRLDPSFRNCNLGFRCAR